MKIATPILAVLSGCRTIDNQLFLQGQLDRKTYEATNKVLEAAGGKWNRKAKAHVFDGQAAERLDQILLTGEVIVPKDEFDFFPTPPEVVQRLVEIAGDLLPRSLANARLLEPSAGRAAILAGFKGLCLLDAIELMPANAEYLRSLGWLDRVTEADFLQVAPDPAYDLVVMNPPFSRQADIHHVNHAARFLKPGGLLIAVMSAGVAFRENRLTQDFRALVRSRGGDIEALPEGSFKPSGTSVNTVIVTIPAAD